MRRAKAASPKTSSSKAVSKTKTAIAEPASEPVRRQVAALPWRRADGRLEICLVTTRETKRWTIPKGWPMKHLTDRIAARTEAEQEAGVTGKIAREALGTYDYWKRLIDSFELIRVVVYALEVRAHLPVWKEMAERRVRWVAAEDAAVAVDEPELSTLLAAFARDHG